MRYTIEGFSQEYAITLKKKVIKRNKEIEIKIDCTDLVILRWFVDFYPKMKKMILDGKEYAWLTHKKIVEDLPLIDISKEAFNERMKKLVEFNILGYQFIKEGGSFSLYCFGDNYINLVSKQEGVCSNTYGVDVQTHTGVSVQTNTKDNNINNTSINNNIYSEVIDYLNQKAGTHYRQVENNYKHIKARLQDFTIDDLKAVIDKKCREWLGTEFEKYLTPETLFRPSNFEKYLNQKIHRPNHKSWEREYTAEQLNSLFVDISEVEI